VRHQLLGWILHKEVRRALQVLDAEIRNYAELVKATGLEVE
jgi:hypothetical protein